MNPVAVKQFSLASITHDALNLAYLSNMHAYILGLDIGTGSTKAVAVTKEGTVLYATQAYYPDGTGHKIQNPDVIWAAFVQCIQTVQATLKSPPIAVSLSSAMHSIMAVDAAGTPLSPLLTWADDRAASIAMELLQQPLGKALYEQCGTPIHALSPLCKIAWWRHHDPELFAKTHKFIGIKEWIWHRLFGVFEIDYSLASATGMFDIYHNVWLDAALRFAGIDENRLSIPVTNSFTRQYTPNPNFSLAALGTKTVFVIGASDGCLANLGTAALPQGTAAITIGTSAAVRVAATAPHAVFEAQLFNYILDETTWITGGPINNGGAAVQWAAQLLYQKGLDDAALEEMKDLPAGSDGLLFLPFLLGERAPVWDSSSSAAFIGLRQQHTHQHLLRAVVEGVCYALCSVLQPLEAACGSINVLHLSGGFTRSAAALQILADCTGKKIALLQTEDASAIGAAYLGLKAMGFIASFKDLSKVAVVKEFYPDAAQHAVYVQYFNLYQTLYPLLKNTMHYLRNL